MAERRPGQLPFQHRKHFVYVGYQFRIRSQQRHIGIDTRRFFIEIAGAQIGKIPPLATVLRIFPQDNRHFCMHFQAGDAIDNTDAGLLHPFSRAHIVLFVETGFQLHEDLPFCAALINVLITAEFSATRYCVILISSTFGSKAASIRKRIR